MDIVLIEPKIPQNTGSIARSCAAVETPLHLVGKVGFDVSAKAARRAGLDYWPWVSLHQHETWEDYLECATPHQFWLISKFGEKPYYQANFTNNDALVFGNEVTGLGKEFLGRYPERVLRIPMTCPHVRSLNLSNAVSIVLFEARRQVALRSDCSDQLRGL